MPPEMSPICALNIGSEVVTSPDGPVAQAVRAVVTPRIVAVRRARADRDEAATMMCLRARAFARSPTVTMVNGEGFSKVNRELRLKDGGAPLRIAGVVQDYFRPYGMRQEVVVLPPAP